MMDRRPNGISSPRTSPALAIVYSLGAAIFIVPPIFLATRLIAARGTLAPLIMVSPLLLTPASAGLWFAWLARRVLIDVRPALPYLFATECLAEQKYEDRIFVTSHRTNLSDGAVQR